ncbi:GlxA family transcriptional regulator [Ectopseudomonas guguanensis]|jgi:transcriptional regulator GlxA family with amidase domain|uniref:GlxA family transcriptional regulator n=1 Tax=Ectopseudomonas guguanensis TaxID=1198456 RepID=UPI0012D57329|nr:MULTISPECIES: helix-turn-helix domain-containing protein [Pseudomonas]MPT17084.1 helix-turn-helix domain-containing protein [Pseudomonas sp.]WJH58252.1 helix-turn-helix domain-containing protein [Pseudomonas guguanensis]
MHITLLLAEYSSLTSSALALEVLDAANRFATPATPPFTLTLASLDGRPVANALGRAMAVDVALDAVQHTDLVLIPGFLFSLREALPAFGHYRDWLRRQHAQGAVIASMCTATFMLAEAGLLDGIEVTTHWAFADLLRRRYPEARVDERRILCEDGRVISSGGATAAMDLLLHLIRRFASRELAQQCSRYLLVDNVRKEQSVYISWSLPRGHGDEAIERVQGWMEARFAEPCGIDELAARFGFGERNFKRRFKEATGHTPLAYLQALRLEKAKELLETTRLTFEVITSRVGYEDSNSFRRLFCQRVGISPAAFRKRFQRMPQAPDTGAR